MDVSNPIFWNNKYIKNEDSWNLNYPTPIFIKWSEKILSNNKLNICIPGCGKGYDAIYFASLGHNVFAVDFSSEATKYLKNKNIYKNLHILNVDFFKISKNYYNYFDIILEYTFFCAIDPSLRQEYSLICHKILKQNGQFIGIILPVIENNCNNPPFFVDIKDFENIFNVLFKLKNKEKSKYSIPQRLNNEILYEYIKE